MKKDRITERLSVLIKKTDPPIVILIVFITSRIIFWLNGGSFIGSPLNFAMQYLDPVLLKEDLFRSLFYQHCQPPLFNFFLGIVLKVSPDPSLSYQILFTTAGALIPLFFYGILTRFSFNRYLSGAATVLFMFNPSLILYENLLYYTFVEGFLVIASLYFFVSWCKTKRTAHLCLFWLFLLFLGLSRSLFHPYFFILTPAFLLFCLYHTGFCDKKRLTTVALTALIAVIPMLGISVKNAAVFGFFGTSSWDGLSLWNKTNSYIREQLEPLHEKGLVSKFALEVELEPFRSIDSFPSTEKWRQDESLHPALGNEYKSTNYPNYNHIAYIPLSKQLKRDALALIRHDPVQFAHFTAGSYALSLWHSSDSVHALLANNMEIVFWIERFYRYVFFGFLGMEGRYTDPRLWIRTLIVSLFFLLFYTPPVVLFITKSPAVSKQILLPCLFCIFIHSYVIAVSSLVEFGENNRFRFPVDSAFLTLMAGNAVLLKQFLTSRFGRNAHAVC